MSREERLESLLGEARSLMTRCHIGQHDEGFYLLERIDRALGLNVDADDSSIFDEEWTAEEILAREG